MSFPCLLGIETEYGLYVEGRGVEDQVEDAQALVQSYPGVSFVGWDYCGESPRSDLRGFRLDQLAFDPEDAKFDIGRNYGRWEEIRSDRVLPNGARFYNDHGHPEYSTPECRSLAALVRQDTAGQLAVLRAARAFTKSAKRKVRIYKNNTDFHGASYGTHEGYAVPRSIRFEALFQAVLPMLVVRQILTGAGKVGSESGAKVDYQISQRSDFLTEVANAETLYRRPIFNTRDEPHADASTWIRLHVISGDANMIPTGTALKVGLVRLAVALAAENTAPIWNIKDPVQAFHAISRDATRQFSVELEGRSWANCHEVLESYFAAAEASLELDEDARWTINHGRHLLEALTTGSAEFRRHVDWAAKEWMLENLRSETGLSKDDPSLSAYDLEYHNIDPDEGLFFALAEMGEVEPQIDEIEQMAVLEGVEESTRARARAIAVQRFSDSVETMSWRMLKMRVGGAIEELDLRPNVDYPADLADASDVKCFVEAIRERQ